MKKKLFLFAGIVLLFCLAVGVACASGISNISCEMMNNGQVRMTWNDSENAPPYEIHMMLPEWQGGYYTYDRASYPGTSAVIRTMIPGCTYDIQIINARGNGGNASFTVPKTTFTDFKKGKSVSVDFNRFDFRSESIYKTFTLKLDYPKLGADRVHNYLLALRTPYGYATRIEYNEALELRVKWSYIYWDNMDFSLWMNSVKECFSTTPSGNYAFEVYLDGRFYGEAPFYVYYD